jgi:aspartyl/asparaginyl beta-hydroxylase (cupin superfamily)
MESRIIKSAILRTNSPYRPYPTLFSFPGIKSSPLWNKKDFKIVKILEENYSIIKQEYLKKQSEKLESSSKGIENDYKTTDHEKYLHQGNWEWNSFISKGSKQDSFKLNFPKTYEILDSIEDKMLNLPFSYAFFSKLTAGSKISAHYGPCNIRLRVHLGIDVPSDCNLKLADKIIHWEEGKCIVFDDTYLHEVHNSNKQMDRTILLFDIWHPEISLEERESIEKLFKSAYDQGWLKK